MQKNINSTNKETTVRKALYERFIKPTTRGFKDYIGIEIEIPILNLEKKAVNFMIVHKITEEFLNEFQDFKKNVLDYNGHACSLISEKTGDIISYDCSYNNLEFSLGKESNLFNVYDRFKEYYTFFKSSFQKHNHTITGIGINPYRIYNKHVPIPNERYLMLYRHLCSYSKYSKLPMYFHNHPEYGMFSSASQVQLDVEKDELIRTINVFSKLEPLKAVLFSNSVLLDENDELLCCRDMFWQDSTHGINPHNIGMYETELQDISDLISYLESLNIYCTKRDDYYVNFPSMNILDYFLMDKVHGEYSYNGEIVDIDIVPQLDDIEYLRSFKFLDLTFRGTIEYRSACTQPIKDVMTVGAFQLGLKHNLDKLEQLLENDQVIYHHGYNPTELRKLFCYRQYPSFVDEDELYDLLLKVLDIASEGLDKRGYGEKIFLKALYQRVYNHSNPAKHMLVQLENGVKIEDIIEEYGKL
ncbi:MAG TPA: glutamylcysteine synthetase [Methanosphaera sp.]|nr:glutamylcysteine synthetase [Methanosphaera sp.]